MVKKTALFILIICPAGLAFTLYTRHSENPKSQKEMKVSPGQPLPVEAKQPNDQFPAILRPAIPTSPEGAEPLPSLGSADEETGAWVARLFPEGGSHGILVGDHLLQRFVLMIHSLTEQKLPLNKMPAKPVGGPFLVKTENGRMFIDPDNYLRYMPLIRLVENIPAETAEQAYTRLYPLLQQAYGELGVSSGPFHQRLLEVIDHLLATPEIREPVYLVQPHVLYLFADPQLESLSAGQKILIRMGPENALIVKKKLREMQETLLRR